MWRNCTLNYFPKIKLVTYTMYVLPICNKNVNTSIFLSIIQKTTCSSNKFCNFLSKKYTTFHQNEHQFHDQPCNESASFLPKEFLET